LPGAAAAPATAAAPSPLPAVTGAPAFDAAEAATLFASTCAACHGATGSGVPGVFPPLVGDPVVNSSDPTEQIATVLHGAQGRRIGSTTYPGAMPPFSTVLSDDKIMEIVNHERSSWGNHAPLVSVQDVATVRARK
jgi:cytochrome c oxidase cbb3-type subunit 2